MFAIVDIETTGGSAAGSGITEIAVVLHNGREVEGRFSTLINPLQKIPRYITALTGISDYMVADAPSFPEVAQKIFNLLQNRVFVAHNVNFDYSFVMHHLQEAGFSWQARKLCTVRYARKVMPGRRSYSLGNICRDIGIHIDQRHRAGGDVEATVQLFEFLLQQDAQQQHLQSFLKGRTAETYLPMHVPAEQLEGLPYCAGVYYFKDASGKIVYVGKARNLKFRVRSHFANNSASRRKQEFIRNIHQIAYQPCVTELHALVLEEMEIKRLWPLYNRSQKRYSQLYGLYALHDQRGLLRLAVEKRRRHMPAIVHFHQQEAGFIMGRKLMQQFGIEEQLMFVTGKFNHEMGADDSRLHNAKMQQAIAHLLEQLPNLHICQPGESERGTPSSVHYLIRKGNFAGLVVRTDHIWVPAEELLAEADPVPDNEYIKAMLFRYAEQHPEQVRYW